LLDIPWAKLNGTPPTKGGDGSEDEVTSSNRWNQ